MDSHSREKLKFVGLGRDDFSNRIWFQTAVVQLSVRPTSNNVLCIKSNFIINTKGRGGGLTSVSIFLVSKLRSFHLESKVIDYTLKILGSGSSCFGFTS